MAMKGFGNIEAAWAYIDNVGFPVVMTSSYSLQWRRTAYNGEEFERFFAEAKSLSPMSTVFIGPMLEPVPKR
ncbi:MAG TPA: hypothetical protein VMT81_00395 [Candidatus Paceibacterota bacterium]|nr:hypothetical protein [Candidatus Paceibacterota bacterium]